MMNNFYSRILFFLLAVFVVCYLVNPNTVKAVDISTGQHVEVFLSPRSGSFINGSSFEVPVLLNTNGANVSGINVKINFDKNKLMIVKPSGGESIIGSWAEPPSYDNTKGTLSYVGNIGGGIVMGSGLIATITFKAMATGLAMVNVNNLSQVFLNDGLETKALLNLGVAQYNILKKLSEGVSVFSETNPSEDKWYNNNSPITSWQRDDGVTGFSFILDNKPFTIPDNVVDTNETTKSFDSLADGLWYFHIKALKNNAWGSTGHFLLKIDTAPPAPFDLETVNLITDTISSSKSFISFFTTDNLSGVSHYEVGVSSDNQPVTEAPVFIEAESPFQVPVSSQNTSKIIVRAIDKAGNVRESFLDINSPFFAWVLTKNNLMVMLVVVMILISLVYYLMKNNINPLRRRVSSFNVLENDIENYLERKKEMSERDIIEREKIEMLEKNLNSIKNEINVEHKK